MGRCARSVRRSFRIICGPIRGATAADTRQTRAATVRMLEWRSPVAAMTPTMAKRGAAKRMTLRTLSWRPIMSTFFHENRDLRTPGRREGERRATHRDSRRPRAPLASSPFAGDGSVLQPRVRRQDPGVVQREDQQRRSQGAQERPRPLGEDGPDEDPGGPEHRADRAGGRPSQELRADGVRSGAIDQRRQADAEPDDDHDRRADRQAERQPRTRRAFARRAPSGWHG